MDSPARSQAPVDFQEHLARVKARGLLVKIERPIHKDTELHALVRWQFLGAFPESERRGFLFNNVVGAKGEKYDMPVAVGASGIMARLRARRLGPAKAGIRGQRGQRRVGKECRQHLTHAEEAT